VIFPPFFRKKIFGKTTKYLLLLYLLAITFKSIKKQSRQVTLLVSRKSNLSLIAIQPISILKKGLRQSGKWYGGISLLLELW